MPKKKMIKALNEQVNAEMYAAYLYLAMDAYFQSLGLTGFAKWMRAQVQEELMHAMKIYDYIYERGGTVTLEAIAKPEVSWNSPLEAFEAALKHEEHVTELINKLVDLAIEEKDHATNAFLQWFVTEQVEEEASVGEIVDRLRLVKDAPSAMFMMDNNLGARTFTMPAPAAD
ncbi:MAG: ferritin [Desulfobulbus sp.]|jgi:ferritin